jgi:hypothetical protein
MGDTLYSMMSLCLAEQNHWKGFLNHLSFEHEGLLAVTEPLKLLLKSFQTFEKREHLRKLEQMFPSAKDRPAAEN